jgi:hypothetical protein
MWWNCKPRKKASSSPRRRFLLDHNSALDMEEKCAFVTSGFLRITRRYKEQDVLFKLIREYYFNIHGCRPKGSRILFPLAQSIKLNNRSIFSRVFGVRVTNNCGFQIWSLGLFEPLFSYNSSHILHLWSSGILSYSDSSSDFWLHFWTSELTSELLTPLLNWRLLNNPPFILARRLR